MATYGKHFILELNYLMSERVLLAWVHLMHVRSKAERLCLCTLVQLCEHDREIALNKETATLATQLCFVQQRTSVPL